MFLKMLKIRGKAYKMKTLYKTELWKMCADGVRVFVENKCRKLIKFVFEIVSIYFIWK